MMPAASTRAVYGRDGCGVFDRIEFALRFHRVLDAFIFIHSHRLDPGHVRSSEN